MEERNENLIVRANELTSSAAPHATSSIVEINRRFAPSNEATVIFESSNGLATEAGRQALEQLAAASFVESIQRRGKRLTFRIADSWIAEAGASLERTEPLGMRATHLLAGRTAAVSFVDPCATKALHIGHLRNMALGTSICSLLEHAGVDVTRQSYIGDVGRSACETLAGYRLFHDGESPQQLGIKSDHFVGQCYAEYVSHCSKHRTSPSVSQPVARELEASGDLADRLMKDWLDGDLPLQKLWETMRGWVLTGHRETLDRFGISIDRHVCELTAFGSIEDIECQGRDQGIFVDGPSAELVYRTGKPEYDTMVLRRSNGFATEHLRIVANFKQMDDYVGPLDAFIHVLGDEWRPMEMAYHEILEQLGPWPLADILHIAYHGMVRFDRASMHSSSGNVVLADEVLDRVVAMPKLRELCILSGGTLQPDDLAKIVILGYFVGHPMAKPLDFSWQRFDQERSNVGWLLARAWSQSMTSTVLAGSADPDPQDPSYRFAVLQSQRFLGILEHAVRNYDPLELTKYLAHFSRWYLSSEVDPRVDRVVSTVLSHGLSSLGMRSVSKTEPNRCIGRSAPWAAPGLRTRRDLLEQPR